MSDEMRSLRNIENQLREIDHRLERIERELRPHCSTITAFQIRRLTMLPIAPGFSPVYTATPVPAGTFPAPGNLPVWTSSDTVNAPVTADATGLIGTVNIPATAVVGTAFTLTVTYTNADGTVATGTLTQTIVAAPSPDITGFTIAQTQ
jgi:hypothetical protein